MNKYKVDLTSVIVKPLYMGLLMNLLTPVVFLGVAYYLDETGGRDLPIQETRLNLLFWVLTAAAIVDGAVAYFLKRKLFFKPLIRSRESFADDFAAGVFRVSLICYSLGMAIAVYGLAFFFLGGEFVHLFFFVFLSFITFQVVRPRMGFLEEVLAAQEKLVEEGRLFLPK